MNMNRRKFLKMAGLAASAVSGVQYSVSALSATGDALRSASKKRPNIVFIITDDQRLDSFGFLKWQAYTPHIDKLASESVYFSRAYATSSVCTPSRFTCLTGMYASRATHDYFRNDISREGQTSVKWNTYLEQENMTIGRALQEAGYATGIAGKWHNGSGGTWWDLPKQIPANADPADPHVAALLKREQEKLQAWIRTLGFDYAEAISLGNYGSQPHIHALRYHNQEWITKAALDFIEQNKQKPFYLYMATTLMHGPSPIKSLKADPRSTHGGLLDEPVDVQPSRQSVIERAKANGVKSEQLYAATWLDDGIGAVMNKLDELGLAENTMVFYFNDHGAEGGKASC